MRNNDLGTLIANFKRKDKIALARLITIVENEPERAHEVFKHFENIKHESYIIGFTDPHIVASEFIKFFK